MKPARLLIAGIALVAGIMAFLLSGREPPASPVAQPSPEYTVMLPTEVRTVEVLVAKADIPVGTTLSENDLQWLKWPQEFATAAMVQRTSRPNAMEELKGQFTRQPFFSKEPIRLEKLIKSGGTGYLAAILPAGKRAMAITIDGRGASSAGGFISPGDFVDIISTGRESEQTSLGSNSDTVTSKTVMQNVRVLAIGQNIQEKNGERVVLGETATLELTPPQTEILTALQKSGTLALTLRSIADVNKVDAAGKPVDTKSSGLTVLRYGVSNEVMIK